MTLSVNIGKQNKIHVICDGEYKFTVDAEFWFSSPYHGIKSIDNDEELAAFYEAVGSRAAFIAGLRFLSYRDHSEKEIINKLVQKGHNYDYAVLACEKLKDYGYINDLRFAEHFAENLINRKGMSIRGIKTELYRKGISRETADIVCENLDNDPILVIIDLLKTKYQRYLSDEKGIRKTVASLQRLGYGWSDIKCAMRRLDVETEDENNV